MTFIEVILFQFDYLTAITFTMALLYLEDGQKKTNYRYEQNMKERVRTPVLIEQIIPSKKELL